MGQKINPNIFRLGIIQKWKTEFFEKKNQELPLYTFKDVSIKEFIERVLKIQNLFLHDYRLQYSESTLNIFISYFLRPNFKFTSKKNKKIKGHLNLAIKTKNKKPFKLSLNKINNSKVNTMKDLVYELKTETIVKKNTPKPKSIITELLKVRKYIFYYYYSKYLQDNNGYSEKDPSLAFIVTERLDKFFRKNRLKLALKENYRIDPNSIKNLKILKLENILKKIFESLSLFTSKKQNLIVTFKCINKNYFLTKKQKIVLKKKFMRLQKFKNTDFFKEGLDILFASVFYKNSATLLSQFIAFQFKKLKKSKFFFSFLKKTLKVLLQSNFSKVKGIKIKIKGRLNGASKAKKKLIIIGHNPIQTINSHVNYAESTCHNKNGSYGIKVWVIEKIKI